jgi:hypothetical protein
MKPLIFCGAFVLMISMIMTSIAPAAPRSLRGTVGVDPQCQQCLDRCQG